MAIRKFTDITNETDAKYTRYKNAQIKKTIEDVFDTGSAFILLMMPPFNSLKKN